MFVCLGIADGEEAEWERKKDGRKEATSAPFGAPLAAMRAQGISSWAACCILHFLFLFLFGFSFFFLHFLWWI
jgi:hypothetical protein